MGTSTDPSSTLSTAAESSPSVPSELIQPVHMWASIPLIASMKTRSSVDRRAGHSHVAIPIGRATPLGRRKQSRGAADGVLLDNA